MIKTILWVLLFFTGAYLLYPKPMEIILLASGGLLIFIGLASIYNRWEKRLGSDITKRQKILKVVYQVSISVYVLMYLLVLRTSWWEHKIIFNIIETKRGTTYLIILFILMILFLMYNLFFYFKHHRWPNNEDLGIKNTTRDNK